MNQALSMLILDSFRGHTTEEVKKILKSRNMNMGTDIEAATIGCVHKLAI
jgi:hypothetical protein